MMEHIERCNFSAGDLIDNAYTVVKLLGEGTFGVVYKVADFQGNLYALKLLRLWEVHPTIREGLVRRFDMEYETGRIDSPYLVHSISHGFVCGNPYIVMELCTGGDLVTQSETRELDLPVVARHVLLGLKALHSCGKVHRDLKPENVLLKSDGIYALTDFGISGDRNKRMTESNILGRPKQIFGTYAYIPPEQVKPRGRDSTVLPTTDIFSFGVMMYQLLTNELPFGPLDDEGDLPEYLRNGRNGNWNRVVLRRREDWQQWNALITGCLRPDFQQRIQSVDEALDLVPLPPNENHPVEESHEDQNLGYQVRIVNGVLLRVMQGEDYGKVFWLDNLISEDRSILTMGRSDYGVNNDINLHETDSTYVSRHHCTLELDYSIGSWVIRDGQWVMFAGRGEWRNSTNGTFVNSSQVNSNGMVFNPGDIISIGEVKLRAEAY